MSWGNKKSNQSNGDTTGKYDDMRIGIIPRTKVDPTEGGATLKESDIEKMSAKEFEEREEEISKAMRDGKFVYDLTGGAR